MTIFELIRRQGSDVARRGRTIFMRKVNRAFRVACLLLPALAVFLLMRLLRWPLVIRINPLFSSRLGHFAGNTELYLCERDAGINVPRGRYVDLCYYNGRLANEQLATMWRRSLRIWPSWLLGPALRLNRVVPGGSIHEVQNNTQHDRDVLNLLECTPPHLTFTQEEEQRGRAGLRAMGIPDEGEFICLIARDSAYLDAHAPDGNLDFYSYHDYRDVDIQNYVLAAEALADLGYYVIRMGAIVNSPINSRHPKVIDYATNGMRTDFMDIYLGANCFFCISLGAGFDAIPAIFRRPMALVNLVPLGYHYTWSKDALCICKKHWLTSEARWLSFKEIFRRGVGFSKHSSEYEERGVEVIENTPEEIRALVIEMSQRLTGTWEPEPGDEEFQRRFWEIYPADARDRTKNQPLHGKILARYGAQFLRDNREWLS